MLLWGDCGSEACKFRGTFQDEKPPALGESPGGRASGVTENPVYGILRNWAVGIVAADHAASAHHLLKLHAADHPRMALLCPELRLAPRLFHTRLCTDVVDSVVSAHRHADQPRAPCGETGSSATALWVAFLVACLVIGGGEKRQLPDEPGDQRADEESQQSTDNRGPAATVRADGKAADHGADQYEHKLDEEQSVGEASGLTDGARLRSAGLETLGNRTG
jgi:hypothetical protein